MRSLRSSRRGFPARAIVLASLVLASGVAACGTTATVTFKSSQGYAEADIVGGDATDLVLETSRGRVTVKKDQIADIDHPGNVLAIAGVPLLVPSVLWVASPAFRCGDGREHGSCTSGQVATLLATLGLGMTIWGSLVYERSLRVVNSDTATQVTAAPIVWRDQGTRYLGGALAFNY